MPYVMLDDAWTDHPKLVGMCDDVSAQIEAEWLWIRLITYSNRFLTDGWIKVAALPSIAPMLNKRHKRQALQTLIRVGLIEDHETTRGGWQIHDYHDWQQSKAEVEDKRRKRKEAGRKGGVASAATRRAKAGLPPVEQQELEQDAGPFAAAPAQANASPSATASAQPNGAANGKHQGSTPSHPFPTAVTNPSLSLSVGHPQPVDNRERDPRVDAAIEAMALSDLEVHERSGARIASRPKYLAACRDSRKRDYLTPLTDLAAELPDAAPTTLVAEVFRREFLA